MGKTLSFSLAHLCIVLFVSVTVEYCFFFLSLFLQVLLWQCEGCGLRVGGWGERRATEAGSTSTGAQEEWPLRQTLIRQRDKTEYEWIRIAFSQVAVDNLIVPLTHWNGTEEIIHASSYINSTVVLGMQDENISLVISQRYQCLVYCRPSILSFIAKKTSPKTTPEMWEKSILSLFWMCCRGSCYHKLFPSSLLHVLQDTQSKLSDSGLL